MFSTTFCFMVLWIKRRTTYSYISPSRMYCFKCTQQSFDFESLFTNPLKTSLVIIWLSKGWSCLPLGFAMEIFLLSLAMERPTVTLTWCVCFFPTRAFAGLKQTQLWVRDLTRDSPWGYKKSNTFPNHTPTPHAATLPVWWLDDRFSTWPGPLPDLRLFHQRWGGQMERVWFWYHHSERKMHICYLFSFKYNFF